MRNDLPKAITAEDVIRRFDLSSLVKDRREIKSNKLGLDKSQNILYNFIDSTLKGLNNTENQVDGKISTWFFIGVPTLSTEPANEWTTDTEKNNHIGDLYYDKSNGNTYQFIYANEEYSWQMVEDDDINEAMALANSNPDTEDGRRNIFVVDPISPYEVGDIWIKSNGDIYRCIVARASGNLNEAEWVISNDYTNDNYVYDARAIIDSFNKFVTANYVCKVLVKTTNNSIELSVSSATTKITNDYTTAINESEGRAEIREGQVLLSANRYTSGEIARVEGEIGDIADITQTDESEYAGVNFTGIPESEPINISVHPIVENISYLYPYGSKNLFDGDIVQGRWNITVGSVITSNTSTGYRSENKIDILPNTVYTISGIFGSGAAYIVETDENNIVLAIDGNNGYMPITYTTGVRSSMTFTSHSQAHHLYWYVPGSSAVQPTNFMIEFGSNMSAYEDFFEGLYPSSTLYSKTRTLRFTNTKDFELTTDTYYNNYRKYYSMEDEEYTLLIAGTDYTIGNTIIGSVYQNTYVDYELPDDLLYYDSDNYDLLEMDYATQTVKITKKCKYNADGTVGLLNNPVVNDDYPYPYIPLTLGDYEINLLGYTQGYLFLRVMSNNVYAGQFITKTQLNGTISVLPHQIDLITAELVSGTSCGITIKLRDANGNVLDSKEANITLSGKVAFDDLSQSGRTTINGSNITTGTIDASVVNVTNINASNVKTGTLKSSNYVANTSGTKIDLSNGSIDSKNFKVSSSGNVQITGYVHATSGEIGGCTISNNQLQIDGANITSGTINSAHIGNLSANKITTGTLNGNNVTIKNLNADYITGGTIQVDRISAKSITGAKIADNTLSSGKLSIQTLSSISANMGSITAGQIASNRAKLNLSNGYIQMFPSDGGSFIFNGAGRMSAVAGVGISSNSNGNVGAPQNGGIDIKGCNLASVYLGCMSDVTGTTEKNAILIYSGGIAMSRQPSYGSDIRLKDKIKVIEDVSWIDDLVIKEYEYKTSPGEKNIGLIAQDYENKEYAKYFLNKDLKDMYCISYTDITNALIKYCQDLKNRILELERR